MSIKPIDGEVKREVRRKLSINSGLSPKNTVATNFPVTTDAYQTASGSPSVRDAFVAKISSDGVILFATYFGGSRVDDAHAIGIDSERNIYLSGRTYSSDFPMANPIQTARSDIGTIDGSSDNTSDTFISKLSADGSTLIYSTYFGGDRYDLPRDLFVDPTGSIYVVGQTHSSDIITTANAIRLLLPF